ncbi:MAG TPA: ATP-binding protein [Gemmatimonadaceae bacterium]|nr:ATP-binding protein [Gemmatimonadaceae bacterium]
MSDHDSTHEAAHRPLGRVGDGNGARVLVVDDTEANRYTTARWLRGAGFEVLEAGTGEEALTMAARNPLDVIVLDVRLPDQSGFDVVRAMKQNPALQHVPIVHLSASFTSSEWRAHGLEAGADAFLVQPVQPGELLATVRSLLRLRAAEQRVLEAAREWRATFDALEHAVVLLDDDSRVVRTNRAAARIFDKDFPQMIGRGLDEVADGLEPAERAALLDAARRGRLGGAETTRGELHIGGRWYVVSTYPFRSESGRFVGVVFVLADVSEEIDLLERERRARAEADAANHTKSEFLAMMSHEIRTPINAIMGYSDLLDAGVGGQLTEAQRDYLNRVRASSVHLLGLVNDVLDLAKVDAGHLTVAREVHSSRAVVDAAIALLQPQAEARGLKRFGADPCDDLPFVGDEHRARQVLVNLLSNAVKFTEPGGAVHVECLLANEIPAVSGEEPRPARQGQWTCLRVTDSGIGISPSRQISMFEPFVQGEQGKTRTHGGTGLGLTISRRLARLMGGDLTVESVEGEGSTFTLWLPTPKRAGAVTPAALAADPRVQGTPSARIVDVGIFLREAIDDVVDAFMARLRDATPPLPGAPTLSRALLEDHCAAYLADVAQQLIIVGESRGQASELFRDGARIQQVISEQHGRQRVALGWSENHIEQEYMLLLAELDERLRRDLMPRNPDVETAAELLRNMIRNAMDTSLRAARLAIAANRSV